MAGFALTNQRSVAALMMACGIAAIAMAGAGSSSLSAPASAAALPEGGTAERCAKMNGQSLGGAHVDAAELIEAGASAGASFTGPVKAPVALCRIRATISQAPDTEIKVEAWLPVDWNGKLVTTGGGGLNGGLGNSLPDMAAAVGQRFAGILADTGHGNSTSAKWAYGHPEKIEDFAGRANHMTALAAKAIVTGFYDKKAKRSYFQGCSGGGREALVEAQRYPDDYDGIAAGAPAANFSGLMTTAMWNSQWSVRDPAAAGLPAKLSLLHDAAIRQCDLLDGVADGVIANPRACRFDPAVLQCKPGADPKTCLSSAEIDFARGIYAGPKRTNGKNVVPGFPVGSEGSWQPFITPTGIGATVLGGEYFRWMVFQKPEWTPAGFQTEQGYEAAQSRLHMIDALNPDLRSFARRGGKLLIYHGWADPVIPATATIDYYSAMRRKTGAVADRTSRLFLMPGVGHCAGGAGPSSFDRLDVLDRWVESGVAPEQIVARKYQNELVLPGGDAGKLVRSRPLCAWPKVARYAGKGSSDDAASFSCVSPKPGI